jgi:hypothetical protein
MADIIETLFDAGAVLLALGLSAYAFKLFRTFRGGIMHSPFRILAPAPLLFAAGEVMDIADNLGVLSDPKGMIHISFEVLFMIALFVGFYQLSKVWNVKAKA